MLLELAIEARCPGPEACFGAGANFGIVSVRRIVEAHGGNFGITFDGASRVVVRIVLPFAS